MKALIRNEHFHMYGLLSAPQCPSVGQILSHYGFSNVSQLTVGHLGRICPAVLTQVLLPSCPYTPSTSLQRVDYYGELLHPNATCLPLSLLRPLQCKYSLVQGVCWPKLAPAVLSSSLIETHEIIRQGFSTCVALSSRKLIGSRLFLKLNWLHFNFMQLEGCGFQAWRKAVLIHPVPPPSECRTRNKSYSIQECVSLYVARPDMKLSLCFLTTHWCPLKRLLQ